MAAWTGDSASGCSSRARTGVTRARYWRTGPAGSWSAGLRMTTRSWTRRPGPSSATARAARSTGRSAEAGSSSAISARAPTGWAHSLPSATERSWRPARSTATRRSLATYLADERSYDAAFVEPFTRGAYVQKAVRRVARLRRRLYRGFRQRDYVRRARRQRASRCRCNDPLAAQRQHAPAYVQRRADLANRVLDCVALHVVRGVDRPDRHLGHVRPELRFALASDPRNDAHEPALQPDAVRLAGHRGDYVRPAGARDHTGRSSSRWAAQSDACERDAERNTVHIGRLRDAAAAAGARWNPERVRRSAPLCRRRIQCAEPELAANLPKRPYRKRRHLLRGFRWPAVPWRGRGRDEYAGEHHHYGRSLLLRDERRLSARHALGAGLPRRLRHSSVTKNAERSGVTAAP